MKQFAEDRLYLSTNGFTQPIGPSDEQTRIYHESLIAAEFDRCHPGDSFHDLKRRARFSKEDRGLLNDWMALAAMEAAKPEPGRKQADGKQAAHRTGMAATGLAG